ncbi:RBM17.2 family protein [Megaselia abdita]
MDLYDDLDTKTKSSQIDGWSSGIKMLQTQLQAKKAQIPYNSQIKKPLISPLMSKIKRDEVSNLSPRPPIRPFNTTIHNIQPIQPVKDEKQMDFDWGIVDEYDPMWPNEYEKLIKDKKSKEKDNRRDDRDRERDRDRKRGRERHNRHDSPPMKFSGMGSRVSEEDSYTRSPPSREMRGSGAAIAPPPSLQVDNNVGNDG